LGTAANLYEQALSALEAQTSHLGGGDEIRSEFRAEHANYYSEYIDLLLRQKNAAAAFEVVERSRAQSLLETLLANKIDVYRGVDAGTIEQARLVQASLSTKAGIRMRILTRPHSQEELADIDKAVIELAAKREALETELRDHDPSFASLTRFKPLTVREVQDGLLDADTVLLEYALSGDRSYLFAVSRRSFSVHNLPARAIIEKLARRWYDLLQTRDDSSGGEVDRLAADLSRIVLGPVAREIRGKRLLIVADGGLQYIPFGVLPAPGASAPSGQAGVPLVVDHEIVNLPSATVLGVLLREHSGQRRPDRSIAVFADPVFFRAGCARGSQNGAGQTESFKFEPTVGGVKCERGSGIFRPSKV
jgi:hypothetical protein